MVDADVDATNCGISPKFRGMASLQSFQFSVSGHFTVQHRDRNPRALLYRSRRRTRHSGLGETRPHFSRRLRHWAVPGRRRFASRSFPATLFWPRRSLVLSPPLRKGGSRGVVIRLYWQNRCLSRGIVVSNFAQQSPTAYDSRAMKTIKHLDPPPPTPPFLRGGADARPAGVATSVASLAAYGKRRRQKVSGTINRQENVVWIICVA